MVRFLGKLCVISVCAHGVASQQVWANLPEVPQGFNASTRIEINATVQAVWDATMDWAKYPEWNPFVRQAIITDSSYNPLPSTQQTVKEGSYSTFSVQIPPLPLPITPLSKDVWLNTQSSKELITHVQPDLYRAAWKSMLFPDWVMSSERWTGISKAENGMAVYESREVFYGPMASVLKVVYEESLGKSFEAQGKGLKMLLEKK